VVYLPLLGVGLLLAIFWTGSIPGPSRPASQWLVEIGVGAAIALVLVGVTYVLGRTLRPFRMLARQFEEILGQLSHRQIIWIAALSGAAEEVAFRGTLQPWLGSLLGPVPGLVITVLIFGMLHFVPDRIFVPWTVFALVVGLICGVLFLHYESVVAPVIAHALLNAINLELIVNGAGRDRAVAT
jgi:uncharacterized protein